MVKTSSGASGAADTDSVRLASTLAIGVAQGAASLNLRVTPRANRDALSIETGQLRVRLRAAPVDGAANAALIALLAERLRLPKGAFTIAHGETARVKRIAIAGVTADDLRRRIASALS